MKGDAATVYYLRIAAWIRRDAGLAALLDAFERREIGVIPLKGWALKHVYPQPHERDMGDVDLLVRQADFLKAVKLLEDEGFSMQRNPFLSDPYSLVLLPPEFWPCELSFRSESGLMIDLHWHLVSAYWYQLIFPVDMAALWQRATQQDDTLDQLAVLSNEDMLAHLCLHNGLHGLQVVHGYREWICGCGGRCSRRIGRH